MVSGGAPSGRQQGMLSRVPRRAFTMRPDRFSGEDGVEMEESELVPSLLAPIILILGAANEIEEENLRVVYLGMCRLLLLSVCVCVWPRARTKCSSYLVSASLVHFTRVEDAMSRGTP
jgi:hypothetical protein